MKDIVSILDVNNKYPPFWEIGGLNKQELYLLYTIIVVFWLFIYYTKSLQYKTSILVGLFSAGFFTYLYNYMYNTPCFYIVDEKTNKWFKTCSNSDPMITKTDHLKSIKHVNTNKYGYMVSHKYYETLKKEKKNTPMVPLYKNFILDKYKNSRQVDQNTSELIM